jgi:hypothetical protein
MDETCKNCIWYSINNPNFTICENDESQYYGNTMEEDRTCDYWEEV